MSSAWMPPPRWAWVVLSLTGALTVLAGVVMRWAFAGAVALPLPFAQLRHAHAHLAYYGLLIPLAWLVWRQEGVGLPSRWLQAVYAVATALAIEGFLRGGYAPEAIVGSTVVGGIWLWTAWRARGAMWDALQPLGAVSGGMVAAMACVPFVARFTRVDPALAHQWVATFLAALLLVVVAPTALSALRVRVPWPGLLLAGVVGAAGLGVWPTVGGRVGLAVYGALLVAVVVARDVPWHLRLVWAGVVAGVWAMAAGWVPNTRPVVIAAIHYVALSACLPALVRVLGVDARSPWWWVHHGLVALLCLPIALQAFGAGGWTWAAAAWGGTGVAVELLAWIGVRGVGWLRTSG